MGTRASEKRIEGGSLRGSFAAIQDRPLTWGERIVVYLTLPLSFLALPVGLALTLLGSGTVRAIGFGVLGLYILSMAVPAGAIIETRVSRRERRRQAAL